MSLHQNDVFYEHQQEIEEENKVEHEEMDDSSADRSLDDYRAEKYESNLFDR